MIKPKNGYIRFIVCMVVVLMLCLAGDTTSYAAEKKNGWSNGYYYKNGKKQKNKWITEKKNTYYVNEKGKKVTGWRKIKGKYYYFNENKGGILRNNKRKMGVRLSQLSDNVLTIGIDMSQWQGNVNWNKIKASGVDFVMLRLGYGKGRYGSSSCTVDSKFQSYVQGAQSVGIPIGIYFYSYATTPKQAQAEAEFTISNIQGIDIEFPVAYDIEDAAILKKTDKATRTEMARTFMETIKAAGYTPMFYCNQNWYNNYLDSQKLSDYEFWYARYTYVEPDRSVYNYGMWQATSTQKMSGITENTVDLNFLYKDYFDLVKARSSAMKYGWHEEGGKKYYYYRGKKLKDGWFEIAGERYYLREGATVTGWKTISEQKYYFNQDGEMQTGFTSVDGKIYLMNDEGILQTTTDKPGVTIKEDGSCKIKEGWFKDSKERYYYQYSDGSIAKNTWIKKKGKKYYCNSKGYRVTGFKKINGKKYYFNENGVMVKNKTLTIDGKKYKFNGKGHLVKKW